MFMHDNYRLGSRKRLSLTENVEQSIPNVRQCCKATTVSASAAKAEDTERSQHDTNHVYKAVFKTAGLSSHEAVRNGSDTRHHQSPASSLENVSIHGKASAPRSYVLSPCYLSGQPSGEWVPQDQPAHEVPDCLPECSHPSKAPTAASVFAPTEPHISLHAPVQQQHGQHYSTLLSAPGFSYGGEDVGGGYISDGAISLGSRGSMLDTDSDDGEDEYEDSVGDRTDDAMIGGASDVMRQSLLAVQQPLFGSLKGRHSEILEANNFEEPSLGGSSVRPGDCGVVVLGGGAAKDGNAAPASRAAGLPEDAGFDVNVFSSAAAFAAAAAASGGPAADPPRTPHSGDNEGVDGNSQLHNQIQPELWSDGSRESVASADPAASVDLGSLGSRAREVCDVQATATAPPAAAPVDASSRSGMASGPAALSLGGWGGPADGVFAAHGSGRLGQHASSFPFLSPFISGAGGTSCAAAVAEAGGQHVVGAAAAGMLTVPPFAVAALEHSVGAGVSAAPSAQPSQPLPAPLPSLLSPEVYLGIVVQMVNSARAVAAGAVAGALRPTASYRTMNFLSVLTGPNMAAAAAGATRHQSTHAPTRDVADGVLLQRDRSVTDSVGEM